MKSPTQRALLVPIALVVAAGLVFASGCAGVAPKKGARGAGDANFLKAPVIPPMGGIFTNVKAPLSIDYDKTNANPSKTGTAHTLYVRDPILTGQSFAWQSCSIADAAANGGISTVEYADYEHFSVLGIFGKFTVIAHGD